MRRIPPARLLAPLLCVLCAALLFGLCYQYDNKYTTATPQPKSGVLVLDEETLAAHPLVFLVKGWELYSGLHTPQSLRENPMLSAREVFIGQYAGFEAVGREPHGSATLALTIALPEGLRDYMLELPEIYSAYQLYINDRLVLEMGETEADAFRAETGRRAIMFAAAGQVTIVIAMRDEAHMYSGLVYPPAFGEPAAVAKLLNSALVIRAGVALLALCVGLFFLVLGVLLRRRLRGEERSDAGLALLFGLICLCFLGYTAYPVVKTLWPGGLWWYTVETVCYSVMLLLVMLLQTHSCRIGWRVAGPFLAFAAFVSIVTVFAPLIAQAGLGSMLSYSRLVGVYFILCALYLTGAGLYGLLRGVASGQIMLCGVAVFDVALVFDRLLPDFEPILTGWFSEWAGATLVLCTGLMIGQSILTTYRRQAALARNLDGLRQVMAAQEMYYPLVLDQAEQTRAARHDLRHHLAAVQGFLQDGDYGALEAYVADYGVSIAEPTPVVFCENRTVNMLLSIFAARAAEAETVFSARISLPPALPLPDSELFALLSNLLENALEAAERLSPAARWIALSFQQLPGALVLLVDNAFDGVAQARGDRLLSRKEAGREGVGTAAVRRIARSRGGSASFHWRSEESGFVFSAEVILPTQPEAAPP